MESLDQAETDAAPMSAPRVPTDIEGTSRAAVIVAAAFGSMVLLFVPGLDQLIFTRPLIYGLLAYAVRRSGVSRRDTLVSVIGPPTAWITFLLITANDPPLADAHHFRLIVSAIFVAILLVAALVGVMLGTRSRAKRQRPDGSLATTRPGVRVGWIAFVAIMVVAAFAMSVASKPDFLVAKSDLMTDGPRLLSTYGSFKGPFQCGGDIVCGDPTCETAHGDSPIAYRSVCYLGKVGHVTVMFSNGHGDSYRAERGIFYRPDDISPNLDGVCTVHVVGRWWEFAPIHGNSCPQGFTSYTGEG